jgi:hypothetical protein
VRLEAAFALEMQVRGGPGQPTSFRLVLCVQWDWPPRLGMPPERGQGCLPERRLLQALQEEYTLGEGLRPPKRRYACTSFILAHELKNFVWAGTAEQGSILLGDAETGADEDDFHALRRRQDTAAKVEKKEHAEKAGHKPNIVPATKAARKVVHF